MSSMEACCAEKTSRSTSSQCVCDALRACRSDVFDLSEAVLRCMSVSRRVLLVVSPDYMAEKSFSLLECRLSLYLHHGRPDGGATIVVVSYNRSLHGAAGACPELVQLRRAAAATVTWRGAQRSEPRGSGFWKRLRLALPVRPLKLGRRLIDSTSSHSDLGFVALLQCADKTARGPGSHQSQRHHDGARDAHRHKHKQKNTRAQQLSSSAQSRGRLHTLPRGRSRLRNGRGQSLGRGGREASSKGSREAGGQTGRVNSAGRAESLAGAELTVETEIRREVTSHRPRTQDCHSDHTPDSSSTPCPADSTHDTIPNSISDSTHDTNPSPGHTPFPVPDQSSVPQETRRGDAETPD